MAKRCPRTQVPASYLSVGHPLATPSNVHTNLFPVSERATEISQFQTDISQFETDISQFETGIFQFETDISYPVLLTCP